MGSISSCSRAGTSEWVAEVAYALGYEDAGSFGRAFRRWFDQSPGKFRATIERDDAPGDEPSWPDR